MGPIIVVTSLSFVKEVWDEIKRKKKDEEFNKETFMILKDNLELRIESQNIRVGDILMIKKNQRVPADLILLKTLEGEN